MGFAGRVLALLNNVPKVTGVDQRLEKVAPEEPEFKPLNAQEAQALRDKHPAVSPWRVIAGQAVVGLVVTLCIWLTTGKGHMAASAAYGAMTVVLPAGLFARGLSSPLLRKNAGTAAMGFFLWEAVKIAVTVAMLFAAPKWVENLSWLTMLVSLVIVMKVYWFVPAFGKLFQVRRS
jgi:ATP synthase protein I